MATVVKTAIVHAGAHFGEEMVELVFFDIDNTQFADARGISQKTVRNHLASIYRKLEVRSRTEAVLCAARMGLTADALESRD